MKLKQADKPNNNYPNRYNFKPMILTVGAVILLSGCANNQVSNSAKESVINKTTSSKVLPKEESKKIEVNEPESGGGMVPVQPVPLKPKNN